MNHTSEVICMANKSKKYSNWAKSFGKSVKFGAKEILSELAPNLAETRQGIAEDIRELKQDIRSLKSNKRQVVNQLLGEEENFSKYGSIGWKNIKQSAKTGKFFDEKRAEKLEMEAMGFDDFDFDGDDGFDMNSSDDSFEDMNLGPSKIVNNIHTTSSKELTAISDSVDMTTDAVREGFVNLNKSNKNTFALSEALSKRFHNDLTTRLDSINNNLVNIVTYNNETWSTYVKASMEFYDKNLELLNSINDAMLRISPVPKKKSDTNYGSSPISEFMSGGFSLRGYSRFVAKNATKSFQNSMIGSVLPMLNSEMILSQLASNPLGLGLKELMGALLPDRFKTSLGNMDKSFNRFIPAALAKLGNYNGNNSFMQILSEVFGIKTTTTKKRFKQGDYEHGAIPFDGETKNAITRVIPGYLSRITSILEIGIKHIMNIGDFGVLDKMIAENAIIYNTDSTSSGGGSFMRLKEAKKLQRREERDRVTRNYSDSRWSLREKLGETSHNYGRNFNISDTDIDDYIYGLTKSNEDLKPADVKQIMRFLYIGKNGGKIPKDSTYLKDKDLFRRANVLKRAIAKMPKNAIMGMGGTERIEAQYELSDYNRNYGKGTGRFELASQLEKGSALDLFEDTGGDKTISTKYRLVLREDGEYYMPDDMIGKYNKDHGVTGRLRKYKTAKDVYEHMQSTGEIKSNGTTASNKIIKPNTESNEPQGIVDQIKQAISAPFNKMADLFDAVDKKMYELVFGKDGLGGNIKETIFGKKDEKTGRYSGGWFSEGINSAKDLYKSTKETLFGVTGKDGNVIKPGILSNFTKNFTDVMNKYIFGENKAKDGEPKVSVFEKMRTSLVNGFGELSSILFGGVNSPEHAQKSLDQAKQAFNKAIPDIGKGAGIGALVGTVSGFGGFGLLGSLFLPGGPIGGALVGGAIGLLSQSKGFREMLFGKEVKGEDGKITKVGGLISSKVQNFFKSKKVPILGGAAMGTISTALGHGIAFGLMPSIAVGAFGPVIAGAAWGLMSHSKKFREVIFGKDIKGSDGKTRRIGGLLNNKMMSSIKLGLPRAIIGALSGMASMGILSQFGLIGSMIATGPIPAAIMGAGLGIASGSKKFVKYMFGYTDDSGKYHSGALDRMKNFFQFEMLEPLKLKFSKELFEAKFWIRKNVYAPIRKAFSPIGEAVTEIATSIKDTFEEALDPVKKGFIGIFKSIGEMLTSAMRPLVKVVRNMSNFMFNMFKSAVQKTIWTALLPLRAAGGLLKMLVKGKDYKSGVTTAFGGVRDALANGSGLVNAIGGLGSAIFNPTNRFAEEEKHEKFVEAMEEKAYKKGSAIYAAKAKALKDRQAEMKARGYNLTNEQIAEMRKSAESEVASEAKIVEDAKKTGSIAEKLAAKGIEQDAERNVILAQIRDGQKIANEAAGVKADDNASLVDEKNRLAKKEEAIQEREEKNAENLEAIKEGINKVSDGGNKKDKKGWFWSLLGGIGSIASGIFGFLGSIGTVAGAALGIYGILKTIFGDKTKGGKSEQLAHSEQAGRFGEYGAKKLSQFLVRHPNATLAVAKAPYELGKAGISKAKTVGSKITAFKDSLLNRKLTKEEFYALRGNKHTGQLRKEYLRRGKAAGLSFSEYMQKYGKMGAKQLDYEYGKYMNNAADVQRTKLGSVVDAVKGKVDNAVKSIEEKAGSLFGKKIGEGDQAKKVGTGIIAKISSALDSFINSEACKNLFGKATEKIVSFKKTILELAGKFADSKIISILKKLFPKKFAEATTKTAVAATGVGLIVTAAFTAYDGITGALEADRMFDVAKEDVTMKMRLVSAFVNAFFGLPPMMWIDLILTAMSFGALAASDTLFGKALKAVGVDIKNFDHRKVFARYIYELASDESDVNKLNDAQKKYDAAFEKYKKDNKKGDDYTKEQWREDTGNKTTWQKYGAPIIDKVLGIGKEADVKVKSFGERISGWMDDMTLWFKNAVKSITSFSPLDWFKELIGLGKDWSLSKQFNDIGDRLTDWLPENNTGFHPIDTTKKAVGSAWDTAKNTAAGIKNFFFGNGKGFSQGDARWKNKSFGSSNFDLEACGPLALANITGKDPRMLAAMANPNDFAGSGIKPSYFRHTAGQLGLGYRENNTSQDMYAGLLSGKPMIVGGSSSNPNSPFYGNGHYVVANGLDSKGNANIYNPAGHGKSMSVDPKVLIRESLGHGGYSGSFSGGGRMSIAEAMKGNPKGNVNITQADIKKYNERQAQEMDEYRQYLIDNDITTKEMSLEQYRQMVAKNKGLVDLKRAEPIPTLNSASTNVIGYLDEESAAKLDSDLGISATSNGQTETITGPGGEKITRKVKGASDTKSKSKPGAKSSTGGKASTGVKDDSLGILDLITGFTLGLGNLFSAIWGGTKYKAVTLEDIKNGIGNKIKGLLGGFGASGDVQKRLLESAQSFLGKGIYYSQVNPGRLDPDTSGYTDCSGLTAAIYKKAFGENLLTPYGGEFNDPDMAGQWNESDPINEEDAQIGDLVFWETAKGIPDNHVGMVIDPANHKAVASNTSTGPAEVTWDDSYWKPMFTGIRRPKVLAELNKKYGGGGGSFDASEGHIDTKKAVWSYLVNDLEMNREGAAGVMGNIEQESRFDTNAYNPDDVDGNPSGGLVQWHAGRFNNLKNYAAGIGKDWTDVQSQVGYLGQELNGPYEHVYDAMRNAPSVNSAVDTWVRKFEIPADIPGEINKRTPMAEGFYRDHENFVGGANGFMSQPQMMMPGFGMMQSGGSSANALAAVLTGGLFNWKRRYDERGRLKKVDQLRKMINAGVPESQIPNNLLKYKAYLNEASGGIDPVKVLNDYVNAHATQEPVNATVRNATADRILPAKVDTGGASMDDLLISIRALDSHAELNQIISYLAAIAENGGAGRNFILDRKSDINMHRQIEMTKRDLRDASSKRILSRPALNNLENVLGDIDGLPVNSLALAQEIAKGGKFRTS